MPMTIDNTGTSQGRELVFLRLTETNSPSAYNYPSSLPEKTPGMFDLGQRALGYASPLQAKEFYRDLAGIVAPVGSQQRTIGNTLSALLKEAIEERHRRPNWDGEDAEPITDETLSLTRTFLQRVERLIVGRSIRHDVELDFVPEPNGDIAVDWFVDHEHTLSVSISNDSLGGVYYFACRYNGIRRTGKSPASRGIPDDLGQLIRFFYE